MKKLKTKKLNVKTDTIRNLTETQLDTVGGGLTIHNVSNYVVNNINGAAIRKMLTLANVTSCAVAGSRTPRVG